MTNHNKAELVKLLRSKQVMFNLNGEDSLTVQLLIAQLEAETKVETSPETAIEQV